MLPFRVLKIVLLVSCAHALVHLLEQSIASVEQVISSDYSLNLQQSGWLGTALRLPYGFGAFASGLLADRFGARRILVLYLIGAAAVSLSFAGTNTSSMVYVQLFSLGAFASMYHPAGLALLANETTPLQRARALGTHGVFGSLGIASAPFIAGLALSLRPGDWKAYYVCLGVLSGLLGLLVWSFLKPSPAAGPKPTATSQPSVSSPDFQAIPYALLVAGATLSGIVYGGVLHFLPRYLTEAGTFGQLESFIGRSIPDAALGNYAAAVALVCGAIGQWIAGRIATPGRLPLLLAVVYAANVPFLIWMTFAEGGMRLVAACLWAVIHFMNQPLYNSLLSEFLPFHRRSAGFGFSNMMGFGIGAAGPPLVALFDQRFGDYTFSYSVLAALALAAAVLPVPLLTQRFRGSRIESP